jgi:LmbE family N-acetylglucosaminyl deacetylase/cytochrome c-type biogenesis protein CcmH/NrfG
VPFIAQFQEGERLLKEGKLIEAEEQFRGALIQKPDFVSAQKGIGKIRIQQNRIDDAIIIYEKIVADNDCDLDARLTLAELYSWQRDYDRSIVCYRDAVSLDTLNIAASRGLARVLRWATRYGESEAIYTRVLAIEPDDTEALAGLAQTYAQQQRLDKALGVIERALTIAPNNPEILRMKADVLAWSNRYKEAESLYQSLLKITPHRAEIYHGLGDLYWWQGKFSTSIEAFHNAHALEPRNIDHLISLGRVALEAGMRTEAESAIQQIFTIDPGNAQAFSLLRDIKQQDSMDYERLVEGYVEPATIVSILLIIAVYFRRRMHILQRRHYYYWLVTYPIIPGILVTYVLFFVVSRYAGLGYFGVVKGVAEVVVFILLMMAFISLLWVSRGQRAREAKTVLAVGAHPDDIELGCGGALAKFKDTGYKVCGLVITSGEQGNTNGGKGMDRKTEATNGASALGLDQVWVYNFKDTQLYSQLNEIKNIIEEKILQTNAEIVITQSANDIHQDHKTVFEATKIAARGARTLLCYEDVSTEPYFIPNYFVDITEYIDDKMEAVELHKTQKHQLYMQPESIKGRAAHRGMQSGVKYAEAFLLYKGVDVCPL